MSYQKYLKKIQLCNTANTHNYIPFIIDQQSIGWLKPDFAQSLIENWPDMFSRSTNSIVFSCKSTEFDKRSEIIDTIIHELVKMGVIPTYLNEPYPVTGGDRNCAVMTLDRSAVSYFGLRSFGQHLNGFVQNPQGLHLWIARRAEDRYIAPGKFDNMVAGGLPWHISLEDNLAKECAEEAGMSESLSLQARATGTVSYLSESAKGLKPDTLYCYDIELPEDFIPVCTDGEVESFELMSVNKVMQLVSETNSFKANCNLVIIDFLVRKGLLNPDHDGYTELVSRLHRRL